MTISSRQPRLMEPMLPTPIREPVEPKSLYPDRMVALPWFPGVTARVPKLLPTGRQPELFLCRYAGNTDIPSQPYGISVQK